MRDLLQMIAVLVVMIAVGCLIIVSFGFVALLAVPALSLLAGLYVYHRRKSAVAAIAAAMVFAVLVILALASVTPGSYSEGTVTETETQQGP